MTGPAENRRDGRTKRRPGVESQRRLLLDTAIALFAERGSRNVGVSELCVAAGVSRPTFYRCFTDKDELVETLYRDAVLGPVRAMMRSPLDGTDGRTGRLRTSIDRMLDAIFEEAEVAALLFVESADPASPAHTIIDRALDETSAKVLAAMRVTGRRTLSKVAVKSLLVACQWIVHDAIRKGLTPAARRAAKAATYELAVRVFLPPTR